MKLTNNQRWKLTKIIIRFLKENNLYQQLSKFTPFMKAIINDEKYESDAEVLEQTLSKFAVRYMQRCVTLREQAMFTKFLKNYTLYDTEELFMKFLNTKGILFHNLKKEWNQVTKSHSAAKNQAILRNEVIDEYKPHVLQALSEFEPIKKYTHKPLKYKDLKVEWIHYYLMNQKLK